MKYRMMLLLAGMMALTGCDGRPKTENRRAGQLAGVVSKPDSKPAVHVYIENSGSMDGYAGRDKTDFKTSVYTYLSDIKIADVTDSLNLFYINGEIIPHSPDVSDFIEKLNPATFRLRGGDRGATNISRLIHTLLQETLENKTAILVSDFIFSPGKGKNAEAYLINQQIGIKMNMAEALKTRDLAVIVYQLSSEFNGTYYNREDRPTLIDGRRPFYIWIMGDAKQVGELRKKIPVSSFKGSGVEHTFTMVRGNQTVDYAIRPGTGKFSLDRQSPKNKITHAGKDHRGKLSFAVNVNFSALLLDDDYLKNPDNYELSDKDYQLHITDAPGGAHGYTHSLNFSSQQIKPSRLSVKLKTGVPQWVEQINDEEGLDIHAEGAMGKTYGISYLINGIYEAFTLKQDFYTEIKISIN
ncbi:MAG: hypothetical protein LBJ60_05050 [Tannerellaceae bacterium]|jgi:hypothetical protein|nr:hypothetical protein [Tannerellaceae bacterium]